MATSEKEILLIKLEDRLDFLKKRRGWLKRVANESTVKRNLKLIKLCKLDIKLLKGQMDIEKYLHTKLKIPS